MAPCANDKFLSGTTRSISKTISIPKPSHVLHAPRGLLKENKRGSISLSINPETGHANFDEKVMVSLV
ncbi:MAG: hypothetical protein FADNKDHG_01613 [Holosporales bacterium]